MKRIVYVLGLLVLGAMIFGEVDRMWSTKEDTREALLQTNEPGTNVDKEGTEKIAYLTFDDGPSPVTEQILDVLKNKNVHATFFLVGNEITPEREVIVKREILEGHSVGVHTFSHKKDEMYCNESVFFEDFNQCSARIEEVTGKKPSLHRFPWGSNNAYVCPIVDNLMEGLKKQGVTSFDWNVSGEDSVGGVVPKATIYQNIAKDLEKQEQPIILLHDSAAMKNTADVLGEVIDLIQEKGYCFGTLEDREDYTFPESWR